MNYVAIAQVLFLLILANGAPVVATRLLGKKYAAPLDGNMTFIDGRPLFGLSKTIRGVCVSLLTTTLCAPLVGLSFGAGLLIGATAMLGDLSSSFIKRRLGLPPSSRATGLDQIPESAIPFLACRSTLGLSLFDMVSGCAIFFVGELLLSELFFRLHLRDRPY